MKESYSLVVGLGTVKIIPLGLDGSSYVLSPIEDSLNSEYFLRMKRVKRGLSGLSEVLNGNRDFLRRSSSFYTRRVSKRLIFIVNINKRCNNLKAT